jgi:hypothetical protein
MMMLFFLVKVYSPSKVIQNSSRPINKTFTCPMSSFVLQEASLYVYFFPLMPSTEVTELIAN